MKLIFALWAGFHPKTQRLEPLLKIINITSEKIHDTKMHKLV